MKLSVENGCFSYKKGQPVLGNMNFQVESGDLLAILGPNGAGKTTLLRCIMGFLKWDSGKSMLDGEEISKMPPRKLWQKIAYVPQAKGTSSALRVEDMILLGCTNHLGVFSVPGEKEKKDVEKIAEQLGIVRLLDKKCNEISGGELQMVLIGRALAAKPQMLILDEPESNLDFKNQLIVLDAMSKLAAEGMCCIFNTHYPTHALMRATKSLIVQKNGAAIFGETAEVVTEKNIEEAFGVETIIGEVETAGNQYKSILPLRISEQKEKEYQENSKNDSVIAVLAVLFSEYPMGDKINELLHEYGNYIVGRMGMPYRDGNVYIINLTLDGPRQTIETLFHRMTVLPGVRSKITYAE